MSIPCTGKRCHPFEHDYPCGNIPAYAGKPRIPMRNRTILRNIPAHAGKTAVMTVVSAACREHPRARGENPAGEFRLVALPGTSPRTRGKRWITTSPSNHLRNIPAHAGKTHRHCIKSLSGWEHPRARGENVWPWDSLVSWRGTSPCTRGKPVGGMIRPGRGWNIPAHAGKTGQTRSISSADGEHPRARGENSIFRGCATVFGGTSPRTRGKRVRAVWPGQSVRNIPAHAGKTG